MSGVQVLQCYVINLEFYDIEVAQHNKTIAVLCRCVLQCNT